MDVYSSLSILLTVITVGETARYRITEKDDQRPEKDTTIVDESVCGQKMHLSHRSEKQIVLFYDTASLTDSCTIHIKRRTANSGTCVQINEFSNIFKQDNQSSCQTFLRFYFGDYINHKAKFYDCPDTRQKLCDIHPELHAVFEHPGLARTNVTFQVIISVSRSLRKRASSSSWSSWSKNSWSSWSPWNSWSAWDSWESWSAWDSWESWSNERDREEREKKKELTRNRVLILIICVLGVMFGVLIYICCKCSDNTEETTASPQSPSDQEECQPMTSLPRPTQSSPTSSDSGVASVRPTMTSSYHRDDRATSSTGNVNDYSVETPADPSDREGNSETRLSVNPSAPEPDYSDATAPPPSYDSLFPAK